MAVQKSLNQTVFIKMKGYDVSLLDKSTRSIMLTVSRTGAKINGPIFLPRRCQKFTVNRSPHVDKKSREQFEIRTYSRLMFLKNASAAVIQSLMNLQIPAGVEIKVWEE